MFQSILTNQARSFAAKAAKAAVPKVEAAAVKTAKTIKAPAAMAPVAIKTPKVSAKQAKAEAEALAPVPKTKVPATVEKLVKEKVQKPSVIKTEPVKVVKIPEEFRPKLKTKLVDEPVSEQAALYIERRERFEKQLSETVIKMQKLVQKANYSQVLLGKYKLRADKLQIKIDRAHSWFKKAQYKAKKTERLKNMPARDSLLALSQKERLTTILQIDTAIRSGYQLFARELNIVKGGNFAAYIEGWKKAGKPEQEMYCKLVASAKASREAASV